MLSQLQDAYMDNFARHTSGTSKGCIHNFKRLQDEDQKANNHITIVGLLKLRTVRGELPDVCILKTRTTNFSEFRRNESCCFVQRNFPCPIQRQIRQSHSQNRPVQQQKKPPALVMREALLSKSIRSSRPLFWLSLYRCPR